MSREKKKEKERERKINVAHQTHMIIYAAVECDFDRTLGPAWLITFCARVCAADFQFVRTHYLLYPDEPNKLYWKFKRQSNR